MMKIKVECEHCGKQYRVQPETLGRKATCKACGEKFQLEEVTEYALADFDEDLETASERSLPSRRERDQANGSNTDSPDADSTELGELEKFHPFVRAVIIFGVGLAATVFAWFDMQLTGGTFNFVLIVGTVFTPLGLMGMIYPRLMKVEDKNYSPLYYIMAAITVALGVAYALFMTGDIFHLFG